MDKQDFKRIWGDFIVPFAILGGIIVIIILLAKHG